MAGDDDEIFMTRSLNVTRKNSVALSGKCEVYVTKDCTQGITLLKLTTDGRKASRGLSATAEL